jgi:hypothetical protein
MAGSGTVIVVGAGPTGLARAAALALAGAQVRVLDRRPGCAPIPVLSACTRGAWKCSILRGQAGAFTAAGLPVPSFPLGLKGAAIDLAGWILIFPTCWTSRRARSRPCSWTAP